MSDYLRRTTGEASHLDVLVDSQEKTRQVVLRAAASPYREYKKYSQFIDISI